MDATDERQGTFNVEPVGGLAAPEVRF